MYRCDYYASGNNYNANTPDNFGNGESYGGVAYGADSNGDPVTFAFDGSGGTYVSSSHVESPNDFFWGGIVLMVQKDTTIFRLMVLRILVIVMMETVDSIRSSFLASVYLDFLIYIKDIV